MSFKINKNSKLKLITLFLVFILALEFLTLMNLTNGEKMENKEVVVFETNLGTFKAKLYLNESPITAGNFKELVEKGFYDQTRFHRVIKDFMIQGGDPLSKNTTLRNRWGTGGPGYAIEDEFIRNLSNKVGTLSMANSGPNSGGSQFFINVADNTNLDWDKTPMSSKHPVFGVIIEGMDVVEKISITRTNSRDAPSEDVVLHKVYME